MGLDIVCNGIGERVGSYSGVHTTRKVMLLAALYYCIDIEKKGTDEFGVIGALIHHLKLILTQKTSETKYNFHGEVRTITHIHEIDYDHLHENLEEIELLMGFYSIFGIIYWVDHSDCDGTLNSLKVRSILNALRIIIKPSIPYFIKQHNKETEHSTEITYTDYNNLQWMFGDIIDDSTMETLSDDDIINSFYLHDVFNESIESGDDIIFC